MNEQELSMFYPTFMLSPERGIIPNINLPRNFREIVPKFYAQKRKQDVEDYTQEIRDILKTGRRELEIKLQWHPEDGLTNISVAHGGLDLEVGSRMPHFQEHNLGWDNGFIAACVATKYLSELLKSA